MAMPLRQTIKVATYLFEQKLRKRDKFPLIVELEPLFACNLKCEGCLSTPAGCWILPQPSHFRLHAKSGSSSTISGNLSRLRSFCSAKYVATLMD